MVTSESLTTIDDTDKSREYRNLHQQAGSRFAQHCLAVAVQADEKVGGEEIEGGLGALDRALQDIRAGMAWAQGRDQEEGWELVRGYGFALVRFFSVRGTWEEWTEWGEAGLKACELLGDIHGMAQTYGNLGVVYADKGVWERAIELYEQSLEIKERLGDSHGMAKTWANMGILYEEQGKPRQARKLWRKALEVFKVLGTPEAQRVREWLEELSNWDTE